MPETNGQANGVVDEGFLRRYRELLDAEEAAFDELEHAFEDGDRAHFEVDLVVLQEALEAKAAFLARRGLPEPPLSPSLQTTAEH